MTIINTNNSYKSSIHKGAYRSEIDGLRALAIIAVIINHFNKNLLPSGFLGVDIFFVISGYVITSSITNREYNSLIDFLLTFYARRIKRIMPALTVCTLITCIVGFFFIPPMTNDLVTWRTGVAALFGLSNIYLLKQSADYFAISTEINLFTQTWSLGVEEQFYLVFPFIVWFSSFARKGLNGTRNLLFLMTILSVMSLCIYLWLSRVNQLAAYFLMPARFWEIGIGCITFLLMPKLQKSIPQIVSQIATFIIIGLLIAVLLVPQSVISNSTIGAVILTSLLIIALNVKSLVYKVFTAQPVVYIGLISYSLYLWHWSVLSISRWTIGIYWRTVPIQIVAIILIAWLSYRYIEKPLRHKNWSLSQFKTITYGIGVSLLVSGVLLFAGNNLKGILYAGYHDTLPTVNPSDYYCFAQEGHPHSEKLFKECVIDKIEQRSKQNNIYLFGDSHARNYLKGIEKAFPEYNVVSMTGCGFIPEKQINIEFDIVKCRDNILRIKDFVKNKLKPNDVVFIGQHRKHQFTLGFQENIIELATYAESRGAKLILLADFPTLSVSEISCVKQPWRQKQPDFCFKTIDQVMTEQDTLNKIGLALESKMSNSRYLDVRNHLCVDQLCSLYKGNMRLYIDSHHITDEASEMLAPYIREKLKSFILVDRDTAFPSKDEMLRHKVLQHLILGF